MDWFNHQLDKVRGNFEKEMAMAHYTAASKSGFGPFFPAAMATFCRVEDVKLGVTDGRWWQITRYKCGLAPVNQVKYHSFSTFEPGEFDALVRQIAAGGTVK